MGSEHAWPAGFLWGVSTSAFQIEGGADADGRGPSVWDEFTSAPGRVKDGSDARTAVDHYRRWAEDVELLDGLGVNAYRFSIAWPRVLPEGRGAVNARGLDFYERLVDALLARGIAPVPTLYHWDTPLPLERAGGWRSRDTAEALAEYAGAVAERLADRVPRWITINEPAEVTLLGHAIGEHAPGHRLMFDALPVAHHQLLAHGLAVGALRAAGAREVGVAMSHTPVRPVSEGDADREAAGLYDTLLNRLFADPLLTGAYPEGFEAAMPGPVAEDLKTIAAPLDWYGVNYYNPSIVGAPAAGGGSFGGMELPDGLPFALHELPGAPRTDFGWPVAPGGLRELLHQLAERYGDALPPLVVTENGCSYGDGPDADGRVDDARRIAYLDGHLRALHAAIAEDGADVRGYFHWSLLDNFEWAEGHRQRFGLVHVDFATQARTPKASYHWYRRMIAEA